MKMARVTLVGLLIASSSSLGATPQTAAWRGAWAHLLDRRVLRQLPLSIQL